MKTQTVLQIPVLFGTTDEYKKLIQKSMRDSVATHAVTLNPEISLKACEDKTYLDILQNTINIPDGIGIMYGAKLEGKVTKGSVRMTGVDMTYHILRRARYEKLPVTIILPRNSITGPLQLLDKLRSLYGNFDCTVLYDDENTIEDMLKTKPVILLAAQGAPKQEQWIQSVLPKLPSVRLAVGVGGTFDFISGTMKRAPWLFRLIGLEWLWRLAQEPKRRIGRILRATIIFPLTVIKNR